MLVGAAVCHQLSGIVQYLFPGLAGQGIAMQQLGNGLMLILMSVGADSVAEFGLVHAAGYPFFQLISGIIGY